MVRNLVKSKKGAYFFVIDVLIGVLIFATTVFIISGFSTSTPSSIAINQQLDLLSTQLFQTELRNTDINNDFLFNLKQNNSLYDPFLTLDEFIYELILHDDSANATLLIQNITSWLPETFGFNYSIDNGVNITTVYFVNSSISTYEGSRSRMSREKITLLGSNITTYRAPAFSVMVVWR